MRKYGLLVIIAVILFAALFLSGFIRSGVNKSNNQKADNGNGSITDNQTGASGKDDAKDDKNRGRILFSSDPFDTDVTFYYLYTINPDGTEKTRLPDFGKSMFHPVWSRDHSKIAYSADVNQKEKIFIMTVDGRENKQVTFGDCRDMFPSWSPDGEKIAYISYRNNTPNLFVVDLKNGEEKQLTFVRGKDTVLWPAWSPKGDIIAYSYNREGENVDFRIRTIKPDGSDMTELLSSDDPDLSDYDPAWSPDGDTIYFLSNRSTQVEIWRVDYKKLRELKTENEKTDYSKADLKMISNLSGVNVDPSHRPRVSPDGKKIVFYGVGSDWKDTGTNLYTLNIDGSSLLNITRSKDDSEWPDW